LKKTIAKRMKRRIEVRYGLEELSFTGFSGNVSKNGIMVRAVRVFGPGTILKLQIKIAEGIFNLKGQVRWAREGDIRLLFSGRVGMGLTFIDPPEDFLRAVKRLDAGIARPGGPS
jgi:hypothetical protein